MTPDVERDGASAAPRLSRTKLLARR